jgi:hypothetical protein
VHAAPKGIPSRAILLMSLDSGMLARGFLALPQVHLCWDNVDWFGPPWDCSSSICGARAKLTKRKAVSIARTEISNKQTIILGTRLRVQYTLQEGSSVFLNCAEESWQVTTSELCYSCEYASSAEPRIVGCGESHLLIADRLRRMVIYCRGWGQSAKEKRKAGFSTRNKEQN